MEHQKLLNLLNEESDSKSVTRKRDIVNNQSNANYDGGNEIIYNTEVLKSNLCDQNDDYILVRGDITTEMYNNTIPVAFKNCTLLTKCIIKIDGTTIDDAEDLDLVMSMYNLIKYSSNYFHRTGTLWFYSKHEATNFNANIESTNAFKSFEYNSKSFRKQSCGRKLLNSKKCNSRCIIEIYK